MKQLYYTKTPLKKHPEVKTKHAYCYPELIAILGLDVFNELLSKGVIMYEGDLLI